jgi:hypothetical protein
MNDRFAEYIRKTYAADEWLRSQPEVNVFFRNIIRYIIDELKPDHLQFFDTPSDYPPPIERIQEHSIPTTEATFLNDLTMTVLIVYECESRIAARAQLLRLLGGFQGPTVRQTDRFGDVAFSVPGDLTALFARGNLAFYAHNGRDDMEPVVPTLKQIDEFLTTEPAFTDPLLLRIVPPSPEEDRLLGVDPPSDDEWLHILARGGEVYASPEGPRFAPSGLA